MTGRELAKAVRAAKGKVSAPVVIGAVQLYVFVEKSDLVKTLEGMGEQETEMQLAEEDGGFFLKFVD